MPIKNPRITKEQAKEELLKIYNILGRNPTRNEFYKLCTLVGCHEKAINILFGKNPWYGLMVYSGLTGIRSQAQPRQEVECLQCKKIFKKTVGKLINPQIIFAHDHVLLLLIIKKQKQNMVNIKKIKYAQIVE